VKLIRQSNHPRKHIIHGLWYYFSITFTYVVFIDNFEKLSGFERGKLISSLGQKISENLETLAQLEVENNGKPIWEARLDIQSCADCFLYFGGIASTVSGKHIQLPNSSFGLIKRESLGVIGGIGAWNYPLQTCSWKVSTNYKSIKLIIHDQ
jgi:acyl-CoA reductase-like NAD-dependent aldehyde dehydrogenase